MNEREMKSRSAAAQMSDALARWERDGGALARTPVPVRDDQADSSRTEAVFADVAMRQGLILERRDDNGAATYRLAPRGEAPPAVADPVDFKLTLEDLETVLMNRNPA